ncbi:hypothetical protein D3C78_819660 [compost metagenome]
MRFILALQGHHQAVAQGGGGFGAIVHRRRAEHRMRGDDAGALARKGFGLIEKAFEPPQFFVIDLSQQVLKTGMGAQAQVMGLEQRITGRWGCVFVPGPGLQLLLSGLFCLLAGIAQGLLMKLERL